MSGWIGVDLDGTLAFYDGWKGLDHIGPPIPAMVERVKRWLVAGHEVKIFTARVSVPEGEELEAVCRAINAWSTTVFGHMLEITCTKDFGMIELWDDRAVQVEANTGRPIGPSTRGLS